MNEFKNILLVNFGGIGDEILFQPIISALRKSFPSAKITLCLEERSKAFVNLTNLLDNYFFANIKTKNKYLEMIKFYFKALTGRYDLVISTGANPLISVLLFFTGIKTRVGYGTSKFASKLLTHAVTLNKNQYAALMYFDLIRPVSNSSFEIPKIEVEELNKIPNSVLVHPGVSLISTSKNIIKTISAKKWSELIIKLLEEGKKVFLAGGPDDTKCINSIRDNIKNADLSNFTDLFGKTKNIYDLAKLIKQAEVLICSDSAPMHIGVAVGTKTIAIFGPTDEKKLLPESDNFFAITNEINCRPCLWDKRQTTCEKLDCLDIDLTKILKLV